MESLEFKLFRKYKLSTYTIGTISLDQKPICNSLEPPVRELHDFNYDGDFDDPGEGKIYGHTAIPCNRYKITMVMFAKHKRMTPMLNNVIGFTEIFMHNVVDVTWTMACIGVGMNTEKGKLSNGLYWEAYIANLVTEAIKAGKECYITIEQ
jgi:hypothetical protein